MSPRTREQFEEIRESRKRQIMDSALHLFATEGYGHCSISMLASHAGISKGLMYNYFESKEELLSAIIGNGMKEIMDLLDPNHDGILQTDELVSFIRKAFIAIRANREFWVLYISVILQPNVKELLKGKPFTNYMENFSPMLLDYFEKKGFEDPYLEMLTLSALIEGFAALMIYAYPSMSIPEDMIHKFEQRIIDMYK